MIYEYFCEKCNIVIEYDFDIGKAKNSIKCKCGTKCSRYYGGFNFLLKGGGWPSKKRTFNKEMTEKNKNAGHRMRKEHDSPKLVGYDYGNGDIREI